MNRMGVTLTTVQMTMFPPYVFVFIQKQAQSQEPKTDRERASLTLSSLAVFLFNPKQSFHLLAWGGGRRCEYLYLFSDGMESNCE